ncbi:MAG: Mu transposase C-terminal domain-containing protein [Clostridia bacterium]|nr:Mu transposase C-terminal domain-containing protein [Clostridia bacterium]
MKQLLFINELIRWNTGKDNEYTERILWIDSGGYILYTIDAFSQEGLPVAKRISDIVDALQAGVAEILEDDPLIRIDNEEAIKESDKIKRDKAWDVIADIVAPEKEPDIYLREKRGPWITETIEKHGVTYTTVYKYLRRYWQRGKNKNSLLPDYSNSGGKGKRKKLGDKKIGRPRKNIKVNGEGVNVDEDTKKIFRLAISEFYDNPKENNFTTAYDFMVKKYYSQDYSFENGVRKPIVIPIEKIPTIIQFRYWYEVEQDIVKSLKARKGNKKFALEHRAVIGKSDAEIIGPGSKYQIDATVADVYLVSRFNRTWIIGRPVIYAVIDCFSRMVAGIYVGLEGPSWIGAMMALANAFTDKVSYCKEYDIDIESKEWPCYHTPQAVLGDRGEMESRRADTLVNGLDIRIENTPSYRADWKGIVEQYFHLIDEQVKPLVPGHIDIDFRERGGKDYRLDAKLDIYQFTKIIIKCVLYHNNQHWMKKYESNEMMIEDDVDPIPRELWNWGIVNRSGKLKAHPKDTVKLNLMPVGTATVTENGLKFKKMYYSCQKAINEYWFEKARNKGTWKEIIAYDPRNLDYVYVKAEDGKSFIKFSIIDKRKYCDKTFDEIEYLLQYEKLKLERNAGKILQSKVDILSEIENIVEKAEKMTNEQLDGSVSNSTRIKNIREKRMIEKNAEKGENAFELEKGSKNEEPVKVISINEENSEKFKYPSHIEYLRKKQKERMEKHDE